MNKALLENLFDLAKNIKPIHRVRCIAAITHKKLDAPVIATNALKSHPFQRRFAKNSDAIYLHAETNAIRQALRHLNAEDLAKSHLYVARAKINPISREWEMGMACPCSGCQKAIVTFDIENVFFTLDGDGFEKL